MLVFDRVCVQLEDRKSKHNVQRMQKSARKRVQNALRAKRDEAQQKATRRKQDFEQLCKDRANQRGALQVAHSST